MVDHGGQDAPLDDPRHGGLQVWGGGGRRVEQRKVCQHQVRVQSATEEFRVQLHPIQHELQYSDWWMELGSV